MGSKVTYDDPLTAKRTTFFGAGTKIKILILTNQNVYL
tara:strand:- start:891 stop:1004 length:114 start_codon:yes stop_codon:yes gene_type:complete